MAGACRPSKCHAQFKSQQSYQAFGNREVNINGNIFADMYYSHEGDELSIKGILHPKIYYKICHHLLTLMLSQTCTTFYFYAEHKHTKYNIGNQTISVNFDIHLSEYFLLCSTEDGKPYKFGMTWVSKCLQNFIFLVISLTFIPVGYFVS